MFDPDATGQITTQKLLPFIRQLHQPLGAAAVQEKAPPAGPVAQLRKLQRQLTTRSMLQRQKLRTLASGVKVNTLQPADVSHGLGRSAGSFTRKSSVTGSGAAVKPRRRRRSTWRGSVATKTEVVGALPSDRPLGTKREALNILASVRDHLHDRAGIVLYYDVYFALLHRLNTEGIPPAYAAKLYDARDKQVRKQTGLPSISASAAEALAAVKLQSLVRARRSRKRAALAKAAKLQDATDSSRPSSAIATSASTAQAPNPRAECRAPLAK